MVGKNVFKKSLVIGIIIIFFGASIVQANNGKIENMFITRGADVIVDPDPTNILQNEISLDLIPGSPGSPALLIAAYNDNPYVGGPGLGVSRSTDGGASWAANQLQYPVNTITGLLMDDAFDPSVTIDTQGNVFVGHISTDVSWYSGMYVHKSTNWGVSWQTPVTIAIDIPPQSDPDPNFRFNDRCQIKADTYISSPYTDNIYVTWIKDRGYNMPQPTGDIYFSYSTDNGNTFSPAATINSWSNDQANMPNPAVASDGTVYVSWLDYNVWTGGVGTIFLDVSTDGGVTWGPDITVGNINLPPLQLTTGMGVPDVVSKGAPVLEVSPNNPNELYITYAADPDGAGPDECDIFFIKSTNGGGVWSTPIRVNDDRTINDQHLPWMDVKPDGTIDIVWYDRRNDASDTLWDVFIARSIDGGNTFSINYWVNDFSFASPTNPWGSPWMGEYLGLACDSGWAHIVFTSSITDSLGDVYYDKMQNDDMVVPQPPSAPTITGRSSGRVGTSYPYTFTSTDPNGDNIAEYIINWGDGPDEIITGPFPSGSPQTKSHIWTSQGTFTIKAKAKDINGLVGPEGTLTVTMPRNKILANSFFPKLLEPFPILKILFQRLGLQ